MNARQRYLETLTFGHPDRTPFSPGGGRESTIRRWHREGLPQHLSDSGLINEYVYKQVGGTLELPSDWPGF